MAKKLGLALGGGAARGYAHIGFLQVLLENGIKPDIVTGCSMGALIGGLYATGCDMFFLEKFAQTFNIKSYVDISLRSGGMIKGDKLKEFIRMLTKNKNIEDADIPYACVAVDLWSATLETFTSGNMAEAIRGSIAIPGIFAPTEYRGRLYIDGGVLEHVPGQAARELGADVVVGVDVAPRKIKEKQPSFLTDVVSMTMLVYELNICKLKSNNCDLTVVPEVFDLTANYTKESLTCIERGRTAALEHLSEIKALLAE